MIRRISCNLNRFIICCMALWATFSGAGCHQFPLSTTYEPQVVVLAEGLVNPVGMALLPDGALLVAEEGTGENDSSAGVSLVTTDGQVGRFISGLRSGRDAGDLSGVPFVNISPDGKTLYTGNFNQGHLWSLPLDPHNSLQLGEPLTTADLIPAMLPLNNVRLINPFDMTFDAHGFPVVSDASGNGVAKETTDGKTRFFHRFADLPAPGNDNLQIQPVPTGITRVEEEYLVTLTGGCPYPADSGQLVAIDEARNQRTLIGGLNMPIDVAQSPDGTIWVLEFARFTPDASCFDGSGYQPQTGRLSRLANDGTLELVYDNLDFPGAILPLPDGSLYISEVFNGRILHLTFGQPQNATQADPTVGARLANYRQIDNYDIALATIIQRHDLQPNPGAEQRETDTALTRLGRDLFFDPILSGDQNIACATCHHPHFAMADGRTLPIGAGGEGLGPERDFAATVQLGPEASRVRQLAGKTNEMGEIQVDNPFQGRFVARNSPTILNSALLPVQFWDGRVGQYGASSRVITREDTVNQLELTDAVAAQALFPVTSLHEMAGATLGDLPPAHIRQKLVARLQATPAYAAQFSQLFGTDTITIQQVVAALAAFERQLIFTNAPWDEYLSGNVNALTAQQKRGALLFFGELNTAVNCAACHSGDLFTDLQFHNLLIPQLGPGKGHGPSGRQDWGRAGVTFDARDRYAFRTPPLRNVALTAPYFHNGAFPSLKSTIEQHANMWESVRTYDPASHLPPSLYSSVRPFQPQQQWPTAAPQLREGLPLSQQDIADLVAFLHSLTDPRANDLIHLLPDAVPSGLALDPLPDVTTIKARKAPEHQTPVAAAEKVPSDLDWRFVDVTASSGLGFRHGAFQTAVSQDPAAAMGAGLCWLDFNNDGWLDLYLVNSYAEAEQTLWQQQGQLPANALLRNNRGAFTDVSTTSGANLQLRGNGCVAADFNLDGWTDLYVTADGPNALLWNNGDGTFSEDAVGANVAAPEWNSAAVVGDLNNDGWPDLFVASYIDLDHKVPRPAGAFPQDYYGLPDRLYLNDGPGADGRVTFREVSGPAGLQRAERGLGALLSDVDRDGDLDLYIANDGQPNRLYENQPRPHDPIGVGFRFVDLSDTADVGDSGSGMGVAGGDFDGDGWIDLFITNWEAELNALYRNRTDAEGHINFVYSTYRIGFSGLGNGMTGWGAHLADFDHDTDSDLLVVNGRVPVTNLATDPELVRLYGNRSAEGHPHQFREWTTQAGLEAVGPLLARGSAAADYDNDGDLDLAINTIGETAVLLRNDNTSSNGNWLQVELDGFHPGASVTIELPDGTILRRERYAGSSYLASEDPRLHFGLGTFDHLPQVKVRWPNGLQTLITNVASNQRLFLQPP